MTFVSKGFLALGGVFLAILIIMAITTASVIGIKTLYQHLTPESLSETAAMTEFRIGDTIEDVVGFTSHVEEYTKQLGR